MVAARVESKLSLRAGVADRSYIFICCAAVTRLDTVDLKLDAPEGIRGGMVCGESDKIGAYVKDRPVRPQDLAATFYHALGVPLDLRLGEVGVSHPITPGRPILDLFG